MSRVLIPPDAELARMSPAEQNTLANEVAASGDSGTLERLSDALLRIHGGGQDGAHPESCDTARRRRIVGHEVAIGDHLDWIPVPISNAEVSRLLYKSARAGLSRRQQEMWLLHDIVGWTQQAIAGQYGIGQPAVSRCLSRARAALWDYIDNHDRALLVFMLESHRRSYRPPDRRPSLPPDLDAARRLIEEDPQVSTHIFPENYRRLEIWRDGTRPPGEIVDGCDKQPSLTFRQAIAKAGKLKKFEIPCNKTPQN